jgi:hypothetical protein
MAEIRLSLLDKDFYSSLLKEDDLTLRRAAYAAGQFAVTRNNLKYPILESALGLLMANKPLPPDVIADLGKLVISLDNIQVDMKERVKLGRKTEAEWKISFTQARAANAVFHAANEDPLYAALESIYEAYMATDDWPALKKVVAAALGKFGATE